ncbi:uncharacterized protein LOC100829124 [Brachypodium distachyon]|uniref:PB1 domain-containing protein n=1 Tax=Brachypodium distachyon TaxID=15368 RepID=I1ILV6_BRADI|nr:uncharacterized protein LOC100829124 [Brachypodium distachyon]KQJ88583.1 hypothetical protein BRADI_4g19634v3 [Brachypodium distachyon]|eukprot:XP_003576068.1 uncharacterized protein LOC100829124 [Brachypodium distachyon]
MAGTSSWSSSCSCTSSLGSLDDDDALVCAVNPPEQEHQDAAAAAAAPGAAVKFLCSYGGRILPRHSDGALRYVGGDNRVVSLRRPLKFTELERKLREMCGWGEAMAMALRCRLPTEDLDALVSVTGDADLGHLLDEYDAASARRDRMEPLKIRAFLFARATPPLSPPSTASSSSSPRTTPYVQHHHYFARPGLLHQQQQVFSPSARVPHHHRRRVHNGYH